MCGNIIFLDTVDSTNTYGKTNFAMLPDGALIVAAEQTAGRGRLGRKWLSPKGENFYASAIFKRCFDGFGATTVMSMAALDTLNELRPEIPAYIKWPNDIYVDICKLGGMLCEGILDSANRFQGVVAGLGLNLNMPAEALAAIDQPATSLKFLTNHEFSYDFFAKKFAFFLNRRYIMYLNSPSAVFAEWKQANKLLGCPLQVSGFHGVISGVFSDIAPSGEMMLTTPEGCLKVNSGDVRITKESLRSANRKA